MAVILWRTKGNLPNGGLWTSINAIITVVGDRGMLVIISKQNLADSSSFLIELTADSR